MLTMAAVPLLPRPLSALLRYCARPAFSVERLSWRIEGQGLVYKRTLPMLVRACIRRRPDWWTFAVRHAPGGAARLGEAGEWL